MSTIIKIIVVLIVLAGGAWLVMWSGWIKKPTTTTPVAQTATSTPQAQPEQNMNGMAAANDATDAALEQDTAAVDAQMQGLTQDSASLDTSLNDKPLPQAY